MTKSEFIAKIADKAEISKKDAAKAVAAFTETVFETTKAGDKIQLVGFGTFEQKVRAEREGFNPATHEKIVIPEKKTFGFKTSKSVEFELHSLNKSNIISNEGVSCTYSSESYCVGHCFLAKQWLDFSLLSCRYKRSIGNYFM